ncbi:unnamed protein product [Acanthoscelides obtectus]|uniref:C2HC/C3H-type domain-containing protein n=1 Tax=Acanthoscelides obtectus TaxID=200917 RepID=A0A9P0NUQ7_ACAOB|nr:unnamed protein product [Acanthoscelides obtectus]CAK1678448.1 Zinc finger protein 474 [Acanthoscelides obtectus]
MTRSSKTFNRKHCKPFLVLPSIADRYSADKIEEPVKMPLKNPAGLKLFTKRTNIKKREDRPLTATLEKPMILDIRFIGLIDMSKVTKEFLNIPNLCKMPLLINKKPVKVARPLSLPPAQRFKTKRKADSDSTENLDDNANLRSTPSKAVATIRPVAVAPIFRSVKTSSAAIKKQPTAIQPQSPHRHRDANNNDNNKPPCKIVAAIRPRKQTVPGAAKIEATSSSAPAKLASNAVAEACKTCGRKDQPERFHSHPATAVPLCGKVVSPRLAMKSTVQKPVAMKYKSKSNTNSPMEMKRQGNSRLPQPTAKLKPPSQPQNPVVRTKSPEPKRATSAKRTLTCYICGREFGSASLPLHEPKCLQKWERENASLPAHLRRKGPPKPNPNISKDEWNKLAWESSQSTLMPCHNCGRTFYPERLIVHERSCKVPQITMKNIPSTDATSSRVVDSTSSTPTTPKVPPTFECYICGKKFGSHSIKIHEKQCLKKWHIENDSLPVDMRSPPPVKKEKTSPVSPKKETVEVKKNSEDRPASSKKPPMFPCYICGRLFTVNSIYIHEPQCLKMWKIENEKLPPTKRKPEPLKPDIKFTPSGRVDFVGTFHRIWENHLAELVECRKCGRKFFPDRIKTHEKACAGSGGPDQQLPINLLYLR